MYMGCLADVWKCIYGSGWGVSGNVYAMGVGDFLALHWPIVILPPLAPIERKLKRKKLASYHAVYSHKLVKRSVH